MSPLWWVTLGFHLPGSAFVLAILIALFTLFLLGMFLGSISKTFWLWAGLRTLAIAILTISIVLLVGRGV
jgi:VIT1/CCC1 family predicted Fe2+/Mn2+ transporter